MRESSAPGSGARGHVNDAQGKERALKKGAVIDQRLLSDSLTDERGRGAAAKFTSASLFCCLFSNVSCTLLSRERQLHR